MTDFIVPGVPADAPYDVIVLNNARWSVQQDIAAAEFTLAENERHTKSLRGKLAILRKRIRQLTDALEVLK
jgi:septal ring factor EnvC (AmiA/AmiB activator)